jgi:hypothetical protein
MICTIDDYYVRDRMRWVVVLSDGQTVYEDDDRPGIDEPSAWKRLKIYCSENSVNIVEMWLQFRSNRVMIEPRNANGYFLIKSAYGIWGDTETFHAYIVGILIDGVVQTVKWKVPELISMESETRYVDLASPSLILRKII